MLTLMEVARQRDLHVEVLDDMGEHLRGVYDHEGATIFLNARLTVAQMRCTLAHELGHAWHQHRWVGHPHVDREAERRADEHAAQLLINPRDYARAERLYGPHAGAIAVELEVSPDVVTVWRRLARRALGRTA